MNEEYEYGYVEYDKTGRPMFKHPSGRVEPWETARHHVDEINRAEAAKNAVRNVTGESGAVGSKPSSGTLKPNTLEAASVYKDRITKALEIHSPVNDERPGKDRYCRYCSTAYPCDTVNALTGQA
jgi:hypothetical protein